MLQEILDHMGSDELAYNFFRASLTKQKIEREQIQEKNEAKHHSEHWTWIAQNFGI